MINLQKAIRTRTEKFSGGYEHENYGNARSYRCPGRIFRRRAKPAGF
jgi:hypothetical protein